MRPFNKAGDIGQFIQHGLKAVLVVGLLGHGHYP
uniref:Uncharacterized protein n=1 Tax=Magnetospirillum gryphiswaldense TaxID=55518 RepID=A4TYZ9_9PROT|nr:hypothetical protein MGR_1513 [Magnetospirillum gryphiswaldense MSR-1]